MYSYKETIDGRNQNHREIFGSVLQIQPSVPLTPIFHACNSLE